MKIVVDCRYITPGRHNGISRYTAGLVHALAKLHPLTMLVVGTAVGAVFATLLFSLTVVSLPMLLEREVDFVTAMLTSVAVVTESPVVLLSWGVLVATLLFAAMLPGFLGLLVVLPVLGHATWHLYRRAIAWP